MKFTKLALYAAIPLVYLLIVSTQQYFGDMITKEDGLIEYLGSLFLLLSSIFFFRTYQKSENKVNHFLGFLRKKNIYFLLLAIVFFFGFGEEISWGQRIFNWETPEALAEMNAQDETNIHNLQIFIAWTEDHEKKDFWSLLLSMERMFSIFWLAFCVLCPLVYRYSKKGKQFIQFLGVPIVALSLGGLFVCNYFTFHLFDGSGLDLYSVQEAKETIYSGIFLLVAMYFYKQ